MKRFGPREFAAIAALGILSAAPTPGDIGGCGQPAEDLDPTLFFQDKDYVDCRQCRACHLTSNICTTACAVTEQGIDAHQSFPADCAPLAHDGEVCLRALDVASCDDYATYVRDDAPEAPSECQFCPGGGR